VFSHIFVSVKDFDRALRFYRPLMRSLGLEERFCDAARPWAGWHSAGGSRPYFVICSPFNGQAHEAGNGQMIAFSARNRDMVRQTHAIAMANGGSNEGAPGLRPEYHPHYFGAYFRDPDGNKFCVACHDPE